MVKEVQKINNRPGPVQKGLFSKKFFRYLIRHMLLHEIGYLKLSSIEEISEFSNEH